MNDAAFYHFVFVLFNCTFYCYEMNTLLLLLPIDLCGNLFCFVLIKIEWTKYKKKKKKKKKNVLICILAISEGKTPIPEPIPAKCHGENTKLYQQFLRQEYWLGISQKPSRHSQIRALTVRKKIFVFLKNTFFKMERKKEVLIKIESCITHNKMEDDHY